ncbi:hypothetical protein E1A91_A05G197300v1 [Gossypium mustelinum]|uniref:Uncharacterized protein n=1 Tax=Gossypium mustelinum TaxID=34275 RepID=A0A5D2Z866_GOSMU|nr:hypothetical protein E1A91_A05G197300v1 [Gossypium mustelinum]
MESPKAITARTVTFGGSFTKAFVSHIKNANITKRGDSSMNQSHERNSANRFVTGGENGRKQLYKLRKELSFDEEEVTWIGEKSMKDKPQLSSLRRQYLLLGSLGD